MTKSNKRGKEPPDNEERKKRGRKSDKVAPKRQISTKE
jgi:hypothetical protein